MLDIPSAASGEAGDRREAALKAMAAAVASPFLPKRVRVSACELVQPGTAHISGDEESEDEMKNLIKCGRERFQNKM